MRAIIFVVLIGLMGCVAQETKDAIVADAARTDAFVTLMSNGNTTRNDEQAFIRAQRKAFHAIDLGVNGNPLPADLAPATSGTGQ